MQKAETGLRLVHVSRAVASVREVREATTGRPVMGPRAVPRIVPKIWAVAAAAAPAVEAPVARPEPKLELAFYRKYTEALLRRYMRMSIEVGRVPSIMGREVFRGHASSYKLTTFEDEVVFCIDVERCVKRLRQQDQQVIRRVALQGYTQAEAAPLLGISLRACVTQYAEALDRLTELFLAGRLLEPLKSCQEVETVENDANYW